MIMPDGQLPILNDHNSANHFLEEPSNSYLKVQLHYKEKQIIAEFPPTTTIRDVIKELLERMDLRDTRPEEVILTDITHERAFSVPEVNDHLTLSYLRVIDGCTLHFKPTFIRTTQDSTDLWIYGPNTSKKVIYRWEKRSTTLAMLLEYIIQKFSLESIERERIHLFYNLEEVDLHSNFDKLLTQIGVEDYKYFDVEIIPPLVPSISSDNTSVTNNHRLFLNEDDRINRTFDSRIALELRYTDHTQKPDKSVIGRFQLTDTIDDIIKELIKLTKLEEINPKDINLVQCYFNGRHFAIPTVDKQKTIKDLKIEHQSTLYFESSSKSSPVKPWSLMIRKFDDGKTAEYQCYQDSTTLGMLLEYIIKEFSLYDIEHKRVHLSTGANHKLNHLLYPESLLDNLDIHNNDCIYVKIVSDIEATYVHVQCDYKEGNMYLDVPYTITIDELKCEIQKRLKSHIISNLKLLTRLHESIDTTVSSRTIDQLGFKPGEKVYATFDVALPTHQSSPILNIGISAATRSSSIVKKHNLDEVTVLCDFCISQPDNIKASVHNTVGALLDQIKRRHPSRSTAQFEIWSTSINIDVKQPNRTLADFGIKSGDKIKVTIADKPMSNLSSTTHHVTSIYTLGKLSKSQPSTKEPVGLYNLGNTCYMNSALQCLAHATPFTQFFLDELTQETSDNDKYLETDWNQFYTVGSITGAYADVIRNLWLPKTASYHSFPFRPTHIKDTIGLQAPRFATYDQQDAQEFMTFLLDEIHKEFKEKNPNESSTIIEELFFGKIQSTITCRDCNHQEKTINAISLLSLPLTQPGRTFHVRFIGRNGDNDFQNITVPEDGRVLNLISSFVECNPSYYFIYTILPMTDEGPLDLDTPISEISSTEVLLIEQDTLKSVTYFDRFEKPSPKLTLESCLREFCSLESLEDSWLCQEETCQKHTKATKQLQLCSLPPLLIIQFKRFAHEAGLRRKIETFVGYPTDGLDLSHFLSPPAEAIYDLFAVCKHSGSIYGGHYIACARHETNGEKKWYKFDDTWVSSFCDDGDIVSRDAYLLFYIKRETTKSTLPVTTS